jgi:uncharacterized protein YraI
MFTLDMPPTLHFSDSFTIDTGYKILYNLKPAFNMKLSLSLTLSTLLASASAGPLTPNLSDRAASKTCSINSQAVVNCRAGPSRSYSIVRAAQPEQRLGIECITDGEPIDAEK